MNSTTSVVARAFAGVPAKTRIKGYDRQALAQSRCVAARGRGRRSMLISTATISPGRMP